MIQKRLLGVTETLAHVYSLESIRRELSKENQHDKVQMGFKSLCILLLWPKGVSAMEVLNDALVSICVNSTETITLTLMLLVANLMIKGWEMTETLAHGYSYEITQRELSYEYPHDLVRMIFIMFRICVLWTKVTSGSEGLRYGIVQIKTSRFLTWQRLVLAFCHDKVWGSIHTEDTVLKPSL